jgi:hypothetical protein
VPRIHRGHSRIIGCVNIPAGLRVLMAASSNGINCATIDATATGLSR